MVRDILKIYDMRKVKKLLYVELLKKGFNNLTESERTLINTLSMDQDIILYLSNGGLLEENKKLLTFK